MSMSEEIKIYEISYYGGGHGSHDYPYRAIIKLRRGDGTLIGVAHFHRDIATMPDHDEANALDQYHCHFRDLDYPNVLDILRNEKPVFYEYIAGKWNMGNIATGAEPVGEGE